MKDKHIGMRLGIAFAVLIAILMGIGQLGLRRMQEIDETLGDITGRQITNLQPVCKPYNPLSTRPGPMVMRNTSGLPSV